MVIVVGGVVVVESPVIASVVGFVVMGVQLQQHI